MRPGGAAGRADLADHLADAHDLADLDVDLGQMPVAGGETVAVVDLHHFAVAALPSGHRDLAVGGGVHRLADVAAQVDAGVHRRFAEERIGAHAERRTHVDAAFDRLAYRHGRESMRVAVDLRAREVDAVELPLEGAGVGARRLHRHERAADRMAGMEFGIDAEIIEYAAHAARLAVVALLHIGEHQGLPAFDLVE